MMKDCMDGKIDRIMTKSISRFARNLADCVDCVRVLKEKGIPVSFEKEGFDSMDSGCEFILSILATMAQEEVNNLSQNIRWSLEHRNASGNPTRKARYGYRKVLEANGKSAGNLRAGSGTCAVGFRFTAQGEVPDDHHRAGQYGNQGRFRRSLDADAGARDAQERDLHRRYLDEQGFKPDFPPSVVNTGQRTQYYIEGHHEPIIDRETFEKVGALISQNALSTTKKWRKAR